MYCGFFSIYALDLNLPILSLSSHHWKVLVKRQMLSPVSTGVFLMDRFYPFDFTVFEDKPFVEEDQALARSLFQDVPPFLLSQILSLPMESWMAIEKNNPKNEEKQRNNVLDEWMKTGSTAMWSVLVETLIELGLRCKAQRACNEKGEPYMFIMLLLAIKVGFRIAAATITGV